MWALLVFCFLIFAQVSRADQPVNLWLQYGRAGDKAFRNHDYAKAESFYLAAIEKASGFGPQRQSTDPNLSRLILVTVRCEGIVRSKKNSAKSYRKQSINMGQNLPGFFCI